MQEGSREKTNEYMLDMDNADKDLSGEGCLLTDLLKGMLAEKWEERAQQAKTMAQEARKAEANVKTKEKRAKGIEGILESVFWIEGTKAMELGNELDSIRVEIASGRQKVISRKLEFAQALSRWQEEMEVEKRVYEEEIAERQMFVESLEGPLRSIEELLDSRWLHNEEREEQTGEAVV